MSTTVGVTPQYSPSDRPARRLSGRPVEPPEPSPGPRPASGARLERSDRTAELLERAYHSTCPEDREQLLEQVVVLNMGVARAVSRRFRNKGVPDEDLEQVAFLALTRAARNFDLSLRHDFLSYAVPTIRGELKKHFRDHGWTVRPPRRIQELQGRIMAARAELTQRLGRSPRPSEIAVELDEELDNVLEALSTDGCFAPASLDRPVGDDTTTTLGELVSEEDRGQRAAEARVVLGPVVRRLGERDRRILNMRFFEDLTQQEIADRIGVTQMQVSRLLSRILSDLHQDLSAGPETDPGTGVSRPVRP
jgi:RNA polymerase sigma-B factor